MSEAETWFAEKNAPGIERWGSRLNGRKPGFSTALDGCIHSLYNAPQAVAASPDRVTLHQKNLPASAADTWSAEKNAPGIAG